MRKLQEWFKEVSGNFQGCFKKVSRVFQVRSKGVSRVFEKRLIGVWKFHGCFNAVLRVFQIIFKSVSRKVQGHLNKLPRVFHRSLQCVSRVFERRSKGIPGKGQICFKEV